MSKQIVKAVFVVVVLSGMAWAVKASVDFGQAHEGQGVAAFVGAENTKAASDAATVAGSAASQLIAQGAQNAQANPPDLTGLKDLLPVALVGLVCMAVAWFIAFFLFGGRR